MEFFSKISEFLDGYTITMTIKKEKNGMIIIMIVPKLDVKSDTTKDIIPLTISGSPEELDRDFFAAIESGLRKAVNVQVNIKEFEASLATTEKKATAVTKSKTTKPKSDENKVKEKIIEEKPIKETEKSSAGNSIKPNKKVSETLNKESIVKTESKVSTAHNDVDKDEENW